MNEANYPTSGVDQVTATEILGASPKDIDIDGKTVVLIERADRAISAFCRGGKVYSVKIQHPFTGEVRGVKIGDDQTTVESKVGKPSRPWPISDGRVRWLYDRPDFMRIDFSSSGLVDQIFL
ncbi:hypothetical protein [Xanthomonas cerealis]|uniref:hypothetical protein n=1 Tax=Xanthomonas cerealis TaxID=3390025 RepID=UPI00114C8C3E|nr:hypothetical protein [Xanthomonas translucens]UKE46263.1 hypothetical protein KHA79_14180 [Xanthomonas translucens pv. cerealis]